jgi:hypothetical protein
MLFIFRSVKYQIDLPNIKPSGDVFFFYMWATFISLVIVYLLLRVSIGRKRTDARIGKVTGVRPCIMVVPDH